MKRNQLKEEEGGEEKKKAVTSRHCLPEIPDKSNNRIKR